jgi:hypothetical protein
MSFVTKIKLMPSIGYPMTREELLKEVQKI